MAGLFTFSRSLVLITVINNKNILFCSWQQSVVFLTFPSLFLRNCKDIRNLQVSHICCQNSLRKFLRLLLREFFLQRIYKHEFKC